MATTPALRHEVNGRWTLVDRLDDDGSGGASARTVALFWAAPPAFDLPPDPSTAIAVDFVGDTPFRVRVAIDPPVLTGSESMALDVRDDVVGALWHEYRTTRWRSGLRHAAPAVVLRQQSMLTPPSDWMRIEATTGRAACGLVLRTLHAARWLLDHLTSSPRASAELGSTGRRVTAILPPPGITGSPVPVDTSPSTVLHASQRPPPRDAMPTAIDAYLLAQVPPFGPAHAWPLRAAPALLPLPLSLYVIPDVNRLTVLHAAPSSDRLVAASRLAAAVPATVVARARVVLRHLHASPADVPPAAAAEATYARTRTTLGDFWRTTTSTTSGTPPPAKRPRLEE